MDAFFKDLYTSGWLWAFVAAIVILPRALMWLGRKMEKTGKKWEEENKARKEGRES